MLRSLHETIRVFRSNAESRFGCAVFRTLRSVFWLFTSGVWDVLRYRILREKQLLIFSETWSSSFCIVCNCFDYFRTNLPKHFGRFHWKKNTNFPKRRWVRSKIVFLSSGGLVALVVTKKSVWELPQISLLETIRVFWSNAESRFGCASFPRSGLVFSLFTSCVWDVSGYRILIKTAFVSWAKEKPSKTTLSMFQIVFLSSAGLDSLVVTKKKSVLRISSDLSAWNNTCFLFKFRVTFWLRYFWNATFGTLALYILRLRCIGIPNTHKNSFCFLSKIKTFRNDVEYVPKMSFWALLGLFLWL